MKIQLLSDLHLELCPCDFDLEAELGPILESADVLVLAGDIVNFKHYDVPVDFNTLPKQVFGYFASKYKHVVYVHGNHEKWHTDPYHVINECMPDAIQGLDNFHWLNNKVVEIEGQRFLGNTMWFREDDTVKLYKDSWADFIYMKNGYNFIQEQNFEFLAFIHNNLQKDDIVVSHHLPSKLCVAPRWKTSPTNSFFVCEQDNLIAYREPKLWLGGHTHDPYDIQLHKTRLVCAPRGYKSERKEKGQYKGALIDV